MGSATIVSFDANATPNATKVMSNDEALVKDMLLNMTGGGAGTDNVVEDQSLLVVTSTWYPEQLLSVSPGTSAWEGIDGYTGGGQLGTGSAYTTSGFDNIWTWKVPFDYSVVEFRAIANNATGSMSYSGSKYWKIYIETAAPPGSGLERTGSWTSPSHLLVPSAGSPSVMEDSNSNAGTLPTGVDVSSTPFLRLRLERVGTGWGSDLQVIMKIKMEHTT